MKRSKTLFVAALLGVLDIVFMLKALVETSVSAAPSEAATAGVAIGAALLLPHFAVVCLATLFAVLGWLFKGRWGALLGGIFFIVSMILMPPMILNVVLEAILCFIAFFKMGNKVMELKIQAEVERQNQQKAGEVHE